MKIKKTFLFYLSIVFFFNYSCNREKAKHFYSSDKSKAISIITVGNFRYIINGYHESIPDSDYVKVSLEKIDRHVADQVVGCWNKYNLDWIILMDNVDIIEDKLNKKNFRFMKDFPKRDLGIRTLEDYHSGLPNCFSISFEYAEVVNVDGAIKKE